MSVKSKQSSKRSSGEKKKKKIKDSDEDFESSEEELDLTKECHPIGYYIHDKAEMINQMFSVIKGNKLKAMLPPILKECDIEQLKLQCLDQLLGMSEKRITCLLEGEILDTSSESEIIESDEYDSDEKNGNSSSNTDRSDDSLNDIHQKNVEKTCRKRKGDYTTEGKGGKMSKSESEPPEQGKTLLEILELEMRARAIRALLKQSGNEKGNEMVIEESKVEVNGIKEISDEVVDLTVCEDEEFSVPMKKEPEENNDLDIRISNFSEKTETPQTEKPNPHENEKLKKLHAELELRNKLFKKKIYRSRKQRLQNEEEERNIETNESEENNRSRNEEILIKQEPIEPIELVVEDPEEGEISSSEDEYLVEIKKELPEVAEKMNEVKNDFEEKIDDPLTRVTATDHELQEVAEEKNDFEENSNDPAMRVPDIDNDTLLSGSNVENIVGQQEDKEDSVADAVAEYSAVIENPSQRQEIKCHSVEEDSNTLIEETSWRDRWYQKGGIQKLVKSSKIYAKVKKRIAEKSQRAKEEVPNLCDVNSDSNSNSKPETIVGSIEEYERLLNRNQEEKKSELRKNEILLQSVGSECISKVNDNEKTQNT